MKLDYKPFIVFGTSKSGTTWLQKILNANPEVSCSFQQPVFPLLKERKNLFYPAIGVYNKKRSPFKGLFKDENEEKKYRYELNLYNSIFSELINNMPTEDDVLFETFIKNYRKFASSVIKVDDNKACGTKSYSDLDLFLKVFPEGKIITIIRDPRDVIVSKRFHTYRMGAYFLGDEKNKALKILNRIPPFRRLIKSRINNIIPLVSEKNFEVLKKNKLKISNEALNKYAHEWVKVNEYILEIEKKYPDKVFRIKYEELKDNFEKIVGELFELLAVTNNTKIIKKIKEITAMPKIKGKESFYRKGQKEDWKNHLENEQLKYVNNIIAITTKKLGYKI